MDGKHWTIIFFGVNWVHGKKMCPGFEIKPPLHCRLHPFKDSQGVALSHWSCRDFDILSATPTVGPYSPSCSCSRLHPSEEGCASFHDDGYLLLKLAQAPRVPLSPKSETVLRPGWDNVRPFEASQSIPVCCYLLCLTQIRPPTKGPGGNWLKMKEFNLHSKCSA